MNIPYLRIIGGIIGVLALLEAAWLIQDRFHQKHLADAAESCAVAAASPNDSKPLDDCLPAVRAEIAAARQGRICEGALLPSLRPETRFAMAQACGAGTKREVARADAAEGARDSLATQLAEARADLGAATERAERRSAKLQEREANGRKVIQTAPRDAGGSILCDADCLRRLGQ